MVEGLNRSHKATRAAMSVCPYIYNGCVYFATQVPFNGHVMWQTKGIKKI